MGLSSKQFAKKKLFIFIGNSVQMKEFCEDSIVKKRFREIYKPPAIDETKVKSGKRLFLLIFIVFYFLFNSETCELFLKLLKANQ